MSVQGAGASHASSRFVRRHLRVGWWCILVFLLLGLVLRPEFSARELLSRAYALGYLIIGAGEHVLRYAPPLVISEAQIEEGVAATRRLIREA